MDVSMAEVTGFQWAVLAGLIVLCNAVGIGAALATATSVRDWYPTLRTPSWTPPPWLFGPAWTVLYILMAVAAWRVWMAAGGFAGAPLALTLFFVQLGFNFVWSFLFFGARNPRIAFVEVIGLVLSVLVTLIAFARHDGPAAWMFVPYLCWVTFAAALNLAIWRLNPDEPRRAAA
jgi:translocator protein